MSKTPFTVLQEQAAYSLDKHFKMASESVCMRAHKAKLTKPSMSFNQRGKVAGSALIKENTIRLNRKLFEHNEDYFLNQVIPHELAHLLVGQIFPFKVKPHGLEWQHIMVSIFKRPAEVTHKLDTSVLGIKTYQYFCDCQTMELSSIRHNKVINNKQSYKCRRCKVVLRPLNSFGRQ